MLSASAAGRPAGPDDLYPIDGDTIVYAPFGRVQERIRIIGVDTPERAPHCRCKQECTWANAATEYTRRALQGPVTILRTGERDKYGRTLAFVYVGDTDLATMLITAGLGRPYTGHEKRKGWCD